MRKKTGSMRYTTITGAQWANRVSYRERCGGFKVMYPSGMTYYFLNGKLHREDGPAFIPNEVGYYQHEWFLDGMHCDKSFFEKNPARLEKMKAWQLFTPLEIVKLRLK